MLRLLCTLLFVLSVYMGNATTAPVVKPVKQPLTLKVDTMAVSVRHFDKASIAAHSKQPDFQYHDDTDTAPSWWDRFWHWFWDLFKPIKFGNQISPFLKVLLTVLQYLFLVGALAAAVFLVLKLMGIDMLGVFRRKPTSANLPFTESLENIHDISFDNEIEKAVAQHNYRLAVRLLYLKCLKQLSDADLIKWQIDKTNSAYIEELTNTHQRQLFQSLTLQFEYVWYGEFAIDGQTFKNINTVFQDFNKGIA